MRKRKKPKHLNDFIETKEDEDEDLTTKTETNKKLIVSVEDIVISNSEVKGKEAEADQIFTQREDSEALMEVESLDGKCCLCEENLLISDDIETSTGSSDSSYANILNSVFNFKQDFPTNRNIPRLRFSSGKICVFCKTPIRDLDLLQNKVIGLKKLLFIRASNRFGESSNKLDNEKSNPDSEASQEDVPNVDDVKIETTSQTKKRKRPTRSISTSRTPSPPTPMKDRELSEEGREKSPERETGRDRPRREKPRTSMSEIERAKIKNQKSDLKFQVRKSGKTGVYIIEYLKEKKGNKYLVKWENRHEIENSWEFKNKIPSSVLQYYEEDLRRLGSPVPVPPPSVSRGKELKGKILPKMKPKQKDSDVKRSSSSSVKFNADLNSTIDDEGEEEYIEDLENFEMTATIKDEGGNLRKSSKPKTLGVTVGQPKKSEDKEKEIKTKKTVVPDDVENSVRKSKREPKPKKLFIPDDNPINESQKKKRVPKKSVKEEEDSYIIESLVDVKDGKYLVKWENYPSSQNTWEPKSSIPKFIMKFYEQDPSRLGMPAPDVS